MHKSNGRIKRKQWLATRWRDTSTNVPLFRCDAYTER
jgi:hypothetical protein